MPSHPLPWHVEPILGDNGYDVEDCDHERIGHVFGGDVGREEAVAICTAVNRAGPKVCAHCGKPAACFGSYEDELHPAYACGECCGHGNEDGWCEPVEPVEGARVDTSDGALDEAEHHRNEIASLRAQVESGAAMLADVRAQLAEEHRRWSKLRAHVTGMARASMTVNSATALLAVGEDMDRLRRETVQDGVAEGALAAVVEELVTAIHIYSGYKIDSRGPYGCIVRAIKELDPYAAKMIQEGRVAELFRARYADEPEGVTTPD